MALRALSAHELAGTRTLFSSFMGSAGARRRTMGQLLDVYRDRRSAIDPGEDRDDALRIDRFIDDMAGARWTDDVVMRIGVFDGEVHVIDGTHRGIAYLACVESGASPASLPALHVDR